MLAYSAINTAANLFLEYSVLKPDTNSLSPSAKSKGVRLVSARATISQITSNLGIAVRLITFFKFSDVLIILKFSIITEINKAKAISYEIVCATFRTAPRLENFLFEAQPARRTG